MKKRYELDTSETNDYNEIRYRANKLNGLLVVDLEDFVLTDDGLFSESPGMVEEAMLLLKEKMMQDRVYVNHRHWWHDIAVIDGRERVRVGCQADYASYLHYLIAHRRRISATGDRDALNRIDYLIREESW